MNVDEYENFPDYLSVSDVEHYCDVAIEESVGEDRLITLEKISILGDHQWHNYVEPSEILKKKLHNYILINWDESGEYIEFVIGICYLFSLRAPPEIGFKIHKSDWSEPIIKKF